MTPGEFRALPEDEQAEIVEYERQVCLNCGNLRSVCSDPNREWHPGVANCWPTATREWAWRAIQKQYADAHESSDGLSPLDGLLVYVSDTQPPEDEDPFL